jgi:hypothetical protein
MFFLGEGDGADIWLKYFDKNKRNTVHQPKMCMFEGVAWEKCLLPWTEKTLKYEVEMVVFP